MSASEDDPELTQDLVRAARARGDEASFTALYARVAPSLHAWARLRVRASLRARIDADDLVQEICLRAHRAFERYDAERGPFRGWLMGIANHVLKEALADLARGGHRVPAGDSERTRLLEQIPDDATAISRRVARDEGLAALIERLGELPEEERALLVHRGLEERSHAEVAELLGLDETAIRKRWSRLLERLREAPAFVSLDLA